MQACPRLLGSGLACGCEEVVLYRAGTGMRGRARWCENQSLGCGELKSMCRGVCEMLREEPVWLWSGIQAG